MGLNLPTWEELSRDEQIPIVNLPLNGNYVVIGGPGTGKTILALYRASRWKRENKNALHNITFLMYNRTLMQYISDAIKKMKLENSTIKTWHSWFYGFYRKLTDDMVPQVAQYQPDWDKVDEELNSKIVKPFIDYLILDEAQDFPVELLRILQKVSSSVTVFGDTQQALDNAKANTSDFTNAFKAGRRVYYLNQNFRNTKEISDAAHLFYTGDPGDIPARPKRFGTKPRLIKCKDMEDVTDNIANFADNNPSLVVGVLLPKSENLARKAERYQSALKKKTRVKVQVYTSGKSIGADKFSFEDDGIKILSYNTAKGLEFDAVFMPEMDSVYFDVDSELSRKAVYVASTRAKNNLTYMYTNDTNSFALQALKNSSGLIDIIEAYSPDDVPF